MINSWFKIRKQATLFLFACFLVNKCFILREICRTKLYWISKRQLLLLGGKLHENQNTYYIFIHSSGTMQVYRHTIMWCTVSFFTSCRRSVVDSSIWDVTQDLNLGFLALETRIIPPDKKATCVLLESTSWFRSDMLSDVCVCVCLSRWGTHLWRLLGRPLWQRRLSSTRWAQWLVLFILTWSYETCRMCFLSKHTTHTFII